MDVKPGYKQTEVGVIPEDWEIGRLGEYLVAPPDYGINAPAVPHSDSLPRYIRITDITDDGRYSKESIVSVESPFSSRYLLNRGDLVFARTGASVGKTYLYDPDDGELVFAGYLIRVRPFPDKLDSRFLASWVNTALYWNWVKLMSTRTGQPGINGTEFSQLPLPVPTLAEQQAIAEALSDVDALISALDRLIVKKRAIKQGAMQELLTGRRRLPGFDGEWETTRFCDIVQLGADRLDPRQPGAPSFCVELENIEQGTGHLMSYSTSDEGVSLKSAFQKDDVLFGKLRAYLRKFWLADREGVCSTEIWVFKAMKTRIIPGFLFQLVMTDRFVEVASTAYGTHMPRSDWKIVQNFELCLPSLNEQTAIAAILSDVDAEIAALERQRDKTKLLKQGMMQELLTGKTRLL